MYLRQVTRYNIMRATSHLARAVSKPPKAHVAAAKHLHHYLAGMTDFSITYERGGFNLTTFWDGT